MSDDTARSQQIERTINREVADSVALSPHGGSVFTIAPRSMGEVLEFAKLMSVSGICIRPIFRGNPGACLAITLQAMKWGADPFAVANKAFEVNGQLSYESQLIHAIVNASPVLSRRLDAVFSGEGPGRRCLVTGHIKGEPEPREYESPRMSEITPKNSPLWKTDPDQQLFYFATRAWARRWVPEVLLGIYTPEELSPTIDLVPAPEPRREDFQQVEVEQPQKEDEPAYTVIDADGVEHGFREAENAGAALIAVLEAAAKMGLDRLDGVWESNLSGSAPGMSARVTERFMELRKALVAPPSEPPKQPRRSPQAKETPPAAPEAPQPAPAPVAAPEPTPAPSPEPQPLPGDMPAAAPAAEAESTQQLGSLFITPPLRQGKPDWRTWSIALFLPKVRRAADTPTLAFLVGDNDDNLTQARAALGKDDLAALYEGIDRRFKELDGQ